MSCTEKKLEDDNRQDMGALHLVVHLVETCNYYYYCYHYYYYYLV
jgi:hypothetical protein